MRKKKDADGAFLTVNQINSMIDMIFSEHADSRLDDLRGKLKFSFHNAILIAQIEGLQNENGGGLKN